MGWELIGGDPAPGSPDSVGGACSALSRIADIASQARQDLVTQTGAAGIERWKGSAAEAFRLDVATLPGDLDTLGTSYRDAASALSLFRTALQEAQADARSALIAATQAKADRDAAVTRHDAAQSEVDALTVQHLRAEGSLLALQTQQQLSIDPVHRSSLNTPITSSRSQVNRLAGDLSSAKLSAGRYQGQIDDADRRLQEAHRKADAVRQTLSAAADRATDALKQAEREAHLPNWAQEAAQRATDWVSHNAGTIKNVLSIVQMICTVAMLVFPVAAPVLMAISLAAAVIILATDLVKDANSPEGFSAGHMWELGGDLLGVVASAAGLGAVAKAAAAEKGFAAVNTSLQASKDAALVRTLSTVKNAAEWGQDATRVGKGYADNGTSGALFAAGTVLLGRGTAAGGGAAIRGIAAKVNGSATVSSELDSMTTKLGTPESTGNTIHVDTAAPPSTSRIASDEAPSAQQPFVVKNATELLEPFTEKGADAINDEVQKHLQPEIDINLHPSPYGSAP